MNLAARIRDKALRCAPPEVVGEWRNVCLQPDALSDDRVNIGILFQRADGAISYKLLNDYSRLRCAYAIDTEALNFALQVVANTRHQAVIPQLAGGRLIDTITLGEPKYTAGETVDEILERLFRHAVPMARPTATSARPATSTPGTRTTASVVTRVLNQLPDVMGHRASELIAPNPHFSVREGSHHHSIYLPLHDAHCGAAATIASLWNRSAQHAELNVLKAARDLLFASQYAERKKLALFALLPDRHSGLAQSLIDKAENAYDFASWMVEKELGAKARSVAGYSENEIVEHIAEWDAAA